MARLLILMAALAAILAACGPPDPGMMEDEAVEQDFADQRNEVRRR